ncbi:hypothetical protein PCE1_001934 [Barthelona sp. PCE]
MTGNTRERSFSDVSAGSDLTDNEYERLIEDTNPLLQSRNDSSSSRMKCYCIVIMIIIILVVVLFRLLSSYSGFSPTIVSVGIITRHGDRAPLTDFGLKKSNTDFICTLEEYFYETAEFLPQYNRRFRRIMKHGDEWLPGNCYPGQLTEKGAAQHRSLGNHLRMLYGDIINKGRWHVRSSDVPRTRDSAANLMKGLLPPQHYPRLRINVEQIEPPRDPIHANGNMCPRLQVEWDAALASETYVKEDEKYADVRNSIETFFEKSFEDKWEHVHDWFVCSQSFGHTLPTFVNKEMLDVVDHMAAFRNFYINESPKARSLTAASVMRDFLDHLNKVVVGGDDLTFVFFSGHDSTLIPLQLFLGVDEYQWPNYASHFRFELSKFNDEHYVRFLFNEKIYIPDFCDIKPDNWCTFDSLSSYVYSHAPRDYYEACHESA